MKENKDQLLFDFAKSKETETDKMYKEFLAWIERIGLSQASLRRYWVNAEEVGHENSN
jgi:hypothetical protein